MNTPSAQRLSLPYRRRNFQQQAQFRFGLVALALLTACASNTAAPEPPIQPSVQATQTAEQPTTTAEAPTQEPAEIPTVEPTLLPVERNYEWTDDEAVTVRLDATEEEILQALEQSPKGSFPLTAHPTFGDYNFPGLLTSISYLKEDAYIRNGDFAITVTGHVRYMDANREMQEVTVALVVENSVEKTTWIPFAAEILSFRTFPKFIQKDFADFTGGLITPGTFVDISFGLPNDRTNVTELGSQHHAELVEDLYVQDQMAEFSINGKPDSLDGLITPFSFAVIKQLFANQ